MVQPQPVQQCHHRIDSPGRRRRGQGGGQPRQRRAIAGTERPLDPGDVGMPARRRPQVQPQPQVPGVEEGRGKTRPQEGRQPGRQKMAGASCIAAALAARRSSAVGR
jgi:hypothetical protein